MRICRQNVSVFSSEVHDQYVQNGVPVPSQEGMTVRPVKTSSSRLNASQACGAVGERLTFRYCCITGKNEARCRRKDSQGKLGRIQMTTDLKALSKCETVIESVVENVDIKKSLYSQLGSILDKETILGTNTSSYSITELVCFLPGLHRFRSGHRNPRSTRFFSG